MPEISVPLRPMPRSASFERSVLLSGMLLGFEHAARDRLDLARGPLEHVGGAVDDRFEQAEKGEVAWRCRPTVSAGSSWRNW